jgi:uncharacterized protein
MKSLFHLAYHVTDLDAARSFYGNVLGCREGRSTETWVDFDFFGHQIREWQDIGDGQRRMHKRTWR